MSVSDFSVRHLIAPLWARWERSPYLKHYRKLARTQFDSPPVIEQRQFDSIRRLVCYAEQANSFWSDRLSAAGLSGDRLHDFTDFQSLPLLTKDDLRTEYRNRISRNYRESELHLRKTSGSTGVSVEVRVDDAAQQWHRACTLRSDQWTGWRLGEPVAMVWGNPEYIQRGWRGRLRNALLERATYLDTLKMSEPAMHRFAELLRRRRPSLVMGHAHSLYLFASFLAAHGGPQFQPQGILSTAMVLHTWERRQIESVFGCPVTDRYGCEEVGLIACECEEHNGLHLNADGVYVELLNDQGQPVGPGEEGRVVVTDLANRAMPILRYEMGDKAVLSDRKCACGRGLPLLERISGRTADYVVTPAGDLISGISLTENFALLVSGVKQMQIIQEQIDRFLFRIVRGDSFDEQSVQQIRQLVQERFGDRVFHQIEYVNRIECEPSGKYRFCISHVTKEFASTS